MIFYMLYFSLAKIWQAWGDSSRQRDRCSTTDYNLPTTGLNNKNDDAVVLWGRCFRGTRKNRVHIFCPQEKNVRLLIHHTRQLVRVPSLKWPPKGEMHASLTVCKVRFGCNRRAHGRTAYPFTKNSYTSVSLCQLRFFTGA